MLFINREIDDGWLVLQAPNVDEAEIKTNNGFVIKNGMVTHYAMGIPLDDYIAAQIDGSEKTYARKYGKELDIEGHSVTLIPFAYQFTLETVVKANQQFFDTLSKQGNNDATRDRALETFERTGCSDLHMYTDTLDADSQFMRAVENLLNRLQPEPEQIEPRGEASSSKKKPQEPDQRHGKWEQRRPRPKKPTWRGLGGEPPSSRPGEGEDGPKPPRDDGPFGR